MSPDISITGDEWLYRRILAYHLTARGKSPPRSVDEQNAQAGCPHHKGLCLFYICRIGPEWTFATGC